MQIYLRQAHDYAAFGELAPAHARIDRLKSFWETLKEVFGERDFKGRKPKSTTVLNLACGFCEESRLISAFFSSGIPGIPTEQVKFFGIDYDKGAIETAITSSRALDPFFYSERFSLSINATFVCGDATNLDAYPEIPKEIDIMIVRHQFIARAPIEFEKMVAGALKRLKPTGLMLFTSFADSEQSLLTEMLNQLPCEILLAKENPHAVELKEKFKEGYIAIDKYICLVKRKDLKKV